MASNFIFCLWELKHKKGSAIIFCKNKNQPVLEDNLDSVKTFWRMMIWKSFQMMTKIRKGVS